MSTINRQRALLIPRLALSPDRISIAYCDKTGGQCPPYGAAIVGRALPVGSSASMQDVIKRQQLAREERNDSAALLAPLLPDHAREEAHAC